MLTSILVYAQEDSRFRPNELKKAKLRVYINRNVEYGKVTRVVITTAKFPSYPISLRLSTENYLLAYCLFGFGEKMPPKFLSTLRISNVLKRLEIFPVEPVTYENGYYALVNATFWDVEDNILRLKGMVPSKPGIEEVIDVNINVTQPKKCMPLLKMMRCKDAQTPQKVVLLRSTILRSYFRKSCGKPEKHVSLTWKIFNLAETELLVSIPGQQRIFVLKRYSLRFRTNHELWRNLYVVRAEGIYNGTQFAARCYVHAITGSVQAIIAGGASRNAILSEDLLLDGSLSRDYSKSGKVKQFKTYKWDCLSEDDYENQECRPNPNRGPKFSIPSYCLSLDSQYKFTLSVASDDNPKLSSRTTQVVNIVDYDVLHVAIVCIANCANDQYNPFSKVQLVAKCFDCGQENVDYAWYVGDQLTLNTQYLTMYIRTQGTIAQIMLSIRIKDGRGGREEKALKKRVPPVGGTCVVKPNVGIEATTEFNVCCKDYKTKREPIEIFSYADRVLLSRCYNCKCVSYLPLNLRSIKVLICDNLLTCGMTELDVTVKPLPNVTTEPSQALWEFINTEPNNVVEMADRGRIIRFTQVIASLATRIQTVESGMVLMCAFDNVHPQSLEALGHQANLTRTLGMQLTPIDMPEHNLLTYSLKKLNEIFEVIYKNDINKEMVEQPFINVTVACVTVYDMMHRLNEKMPRPPQNIFDEYQNALHNYQLNQDLIDKLAKDISGYDDKEAYDRSMTWLTAMWQTERLYQYLSMARKHGLQADPNEIMSEAVALEIQCFDIEQDQHYWIETSDSMHVVHFKPGLLQEVKALHTKHICLKVISTIRELNWWYPEEKQPSSVLLSVRIYVHRDNFRTERRLHRSEIIFRTIVGKYKPALERPNVTGDPRLMEIPKLINFTNVDLGKEMGNSSRIARSIYEEEEDDLIFDERKRETRHILDDDEDEYTISDAGRYINCLESDSLKYMQWVRLYRINVEGHAMITVRFKESTHELQVLLYMGLPPKSWKALVNKAKCLVPARSSNKTMVIRNNCMILRRVYMAIQINGAAGYAENADTPVTDGPAMFSFVFQERSCDYWTYSLSEKSQHWSHDHCVPVLEYQKKGTLHCTCTVLGTYTSYVYHIPAIVIPLELGHVRMNKVLLSIYIVIFVLTFLWLLVLVIWCNNRPGKTVVCDMSGLEHECSRDVHDLLIFLKTGGRINAQTTATVRLIFQTTQRSELQFTLMQDPEKPQLTRNSTYVLLMRTRDIRIPTRVAVAHNNAGRYPSWYLRRIELLDVQKQLTQVFIVNRWVRQKFLILSSSMVLKTGDYRIVEKWRERFFSEFERLWINWGLWHPLTGKWRESKNYDSLSRAQRSCVFVSKIMVTYCIIACCIGPSTRHSAYEDRKLSINIKDLVPMFIYCATATNLIHFIFVSIILRGIL